MPFLSAARAGTVCGILCRTGKTLSGNRRSLGDLERTGSEKLLAPETGPRTLYLNPPCGLQRDQNGGSFRNGDERRNRLLPGTPDQFRLSGSSVPQRAVFLHRCSERTSVFRTQYAGNAVRCRNRPSAVACRTIPRLRAAGLVFRDRNTGTPPVRLE